MAIDSENMRVRICACDGKAVAGKAAAVGAGVSAAVAPAAAPGVVGLVGFGANGVAAGTCCDSRSDIGNLKHLTLPRIMGGRGSKWYRERRCGFTLRGSTECRCRRCTTRRRDRYSCSCRCSRHRWSQLRCLSRCQES